MSFWTSFRNIVTAPVRAPVNLVGNIVSGKNVAQSYGQAVATSATPRSAPAAQGLQLANRAVGLSRLTFAVTGDIQKGLQGVSDAGLADRMVTRREALDFGKASLEAGALYAGAVAAAPAIGATSPLTIGATSVLAGSGVKKAIEGKPQDLVSQVAGVFGFGGLATDFFGDPYPHNPAGGGAPGLGGAVLEIGPSPIPWGPLILGGSLLFALAILSKGK